MKNASYYISYSVTLTCQGNKEYAYYLNEEPDGDTDNEHYKMAQKKYKKAKEMLKELKKNFDISLKHDELKRLIKKAQDKGKKEFSEIQKYVKKKLKEDGLL